MPVGKETAVRVKIFDANGRIELHLSCLVTLPIRSAATESIAARH